VTLITRKVKSQLRSGKFRELKNAGQGAWQSQAILRGYELLGRSLGLFHDKIDVDAADNAIMETLI
jgi:hypothetical protein